MIPVAIAVLQCGIGLVFLVAGTAKLLDRDSAGDTMWVFGAPAAIRSRLRGILFLAELVVAVAVFVAPRWGLLGAAALLTVFCVVVAGNLAAGKHPECRCFGNLSSGKLSWLTFVRNAILAGLAITAGFADSRHFISVSTPVSIRAMLLVLGGSVVVIAGFWFAIHLLRNQGRLLRRIESLENTLFRVGLAHKNNEPSDRIELSQVCDLYQGDGKRLPWNSLFEDSPMTCLVFMFPGCSACRELRHMMEDRKTTMPVTYVIPSLPDGNERVEQDRTSFRVAIDKESRFARGLGISSYPAAAVFSSNKRLQREVAVGVERILELIDVGLSSASLSSVGLEHSSDGIGSNHGTDRNVRGGGTVGGVSLGLRGGRRFEPTSFVGRDALYVFWNSRCVYCQGIKEEVLQLFGRVKVFGSPRVVLVESGEGQTWSSDVIDMATFWDPDFLIGRHFGVTGTPGAVLLDGKGQLVLGPAVGTDAVLGLLGDQLGGIAGK